MIPPSPKTPNADSSPGAVLFIVTTVQFLTPFMSSSVGIALPVIGREFNASATQLGLIQMMYILAVSVTMLPAGRFADIHGRKRIFIAGTVITILTTLAIPISTGIRTFILFRIFQGIGGAMITATSFAILTSVFPESKRGKAMGIIVAFVYLGLATGPTLGGIIATHMGWRWIFYFMVPFQITALVLTLTRLCGEWADSKGDAFDWQGTIVFALALSILITGMTQINKMPWAWPMIMAGLLGLGLFFQLQKKTEHPLIDVQLLTGNPTFTLSNVATLINYAASFGIIFLFSLYLQYTKGFSAQTAGIIMMVQPLTQALVSPLAGRLADRYPATWIATLGMASCTLGLFIASFLVNTTPLSLILTILVLLGVGFGFFSTPNMTAIMSSVQPRYYGTASSLVGTMRTQGMLVSMAIVTVIINHYLGDQAVTPENMNDFMKSMQLSLWVYTAMGVVGILFSMGREVGRIKQ
ncbi:drug resistance transporter, EmrB/QacA subfamily [Desulfocicer vacuolatum DSM 3385]|uniref:Drug resistance transporter, EmrB/QacA subfamily n=1 Tax=Desulfocicer vacuolatum DSM 3385 TaxID=1121400 RepID=A0A1W2EQR7_9BACT|nr:MFS transporter [Desulfocicer vacuolatum]SMD12064.1 drug resistance transporter, EmrB/QacA subfamily [Desulfocicer vacuolatum DSM 3385]